jgi:hypothetical protein
LGSAVLIKLFDLDCGGCTDGVFAVDERVHGTPGECREMCLFTVCDDAEKDDVVDTAE